MAEKLSEVQLEAIIAQQIESARHHDKHERSGSRDKAIDYYFGNMDKYVPPEANRSKIVSRDVASSIDTTLPQVVRVFSSTDKFAIAEPTGADDIEFAKQATVGINYVFFKDNRGDDLIYDATWDALAHANAIVKTYYDDTPVYTTSFHSDLSDDQVAQLLAPDEDGNSPEVLAHSSRPEMVPDEMGQPIQAMFHDIKIKRKKVDGSFVIDVIPPDEFLIHGDAIKTADAAFTDHWQRKTRSDLIGMGYSKDDVWKIPEASRVETPEEQARRTFGGDIEAPDKSMELVDYHECYIRVDVDGDGEAELVRACYGGPGGKSNGALLDWEVWEDENPFDDIKCKPIPHRWLARSQADDTMDIQDVQTVLKRQLLNNIYWINNPQRFAQGKIKNPDALDNPIFGQTVFGDPGASVTELPVPFIGDKTLLAMKHIEEERQKRTGIVAQGEAIDPDELQNQTAAAVHDKKDSRYSQVEQYARNMASGWSNVISKLLRLMIKHQDYARKVMFNGKEVVIDPRFWNADMNVTINVGLGTGSRDRDLQMMGQVLTSQLMLADRFMAAGATEDAIDMLPKVIQTMTKMAESAGIRNPEDFYPEYTEDKVNKLKELAKQPPPPDPAIKLEEIKGENAKELKQVDAQVSVEQARIKAEGDIVKNRAELEADLQTAAADRQNALLLEQQKAQNAFNLDAQRIASTEAIKMAELNWQRYELDAKTQLEREKMANAATIAAMKPKPEPGKPAGK